MQVVYRAGLTVIRFRETIPFMNRYVASVLGLVVLGCIGAAEIVLLSSLRDVIPLIWTNDK